MALNWKRFRLAFRGPGHLAWAVRRVLRRSPAGELERRFLAGRALMPDTVVVNITSRCNLRCAMCMQPREAGGAGASPTLSLGHAEMTPADWMRVVDQTLPARPAFYFSGGEPLLYKGMIDILAHVKKHRLIAAMVTNATALEHFAEDLTRVGVDNVTVSLDGPEAVHDQLRGVPGTFRRAVDGIRALREAKRRAGAAFPAIKVNCVITPRNFETLEETYRLMPDLGVEEFNLQHPMFDTAGNVALHNRVFATRMGENKDSTAVSKDAGEFYEELFDAEKFERLEKILDTVLGAKEPRTRVSCFPEIRRTEWRAYYLDMKHEFPPRCMHPWAHMRLLPDGSFEPCLHHVVGNVRDTPALELWNSARMRHFRQELQKGLFPACARCCYRCY